MTLSHSGTAPETIVYSVTPSIGGCNGSPITYTITVNPGPIMNPIAPEVICSGQGFTTPVFSSPVSGITYTWSLTNTNVPASISGHPTASGTGNISLYKGVVDYLLVASSITSKGEIIYKEKLEELLDKLK
jgi:hypothetical protein